MSTDDDPDSLDGTQCPANKLVITPSRPIPTGAPFVVQVAYTGRPGVHNDGDGTTEGWFRNDQPGDLGSFVTTEPVATEDWMPLNDHPSAKPTYDFYDTVTLGKTAIANGELISQRNNRPSPEFPSGSTTWHWHSPERIASYLVENSIGSFDLTERLAASGIQYYEAQDSAIPPDDAAANKAIMDMQEDIVNFQSLFNGPFPFTTDGIVIGVPEASFDEEMQTKITFAGSFIDLDTLNHENMHQWWGDNVSEANYNLTFFKEGLATLGEFLFDARNAQTAAGGPGTPAGDAAFEDSLISTFDDTLRRRHQRWPVDRSAIQSEPVHAVRRRYDLFASGHRVHRAATDPRPEELRRRAAAHAINLPPGEHHRATAGSGLQRVPAEPHAGVHRGAQPLLHAVVRHRLSARRRREQATDNRSRARRRRIHLPPLNYWGASHTAMTAYCTAAAAITRVWKSSWYPNTAGAGSGRLTA